jgi:beta-mannosidase
VGVAAVDLSGRWRAAVADPERRRQFSAPHFDDHADADWHDLEVPGHWRSTPAFADSDGPLLYRRRFDTDSAEQSNPSNSAPTEGRRWWLVLDGTFYLGDVWLDGHYVGDTEGYFFPHQFDVTEFVATGAEHLLAVEVACPPQTDTARKRNLTGSFQHSTWLDPTWNPGGLWRPVRLESSGVLRIRHARVRCVEADSHRAVLALRAVVDTTVPTTATLRTTYAPAGQPDEARDHELHHVLAAGENRVEWTVTVNDPELWWPHALGDQPLYDIAIEVYGDDDDLALPPSDLRRVRTGLRSVRLDRWILSVNGEQLFLKGTNLAPTRQDLAAVTSDEIHADVAAAKDLGLDLLRVHSHIARPELYEAADQAGMLVWQDLPLQWSYARSVRQQALRQAREAVDLLAHHPSIAVWCAHSEPTTPAGSDDELGGSGSRRRRIRRRVEQALPTWNKSVLDPSLRRTLRSTDRSRPVVAGSGVLPHLPLLDGSASHLWFGWEYGDVDDLARSARRWPRLVRFVSEFGSASVPISAEFCEPEKWPHLDWDHLAAVHGLRRDLLDRIADPATFDTFEAWRDATQAYQAHLLRRQIEALRLLKYRPTGGFAQFLLADGHPAISGSLLDHEGVPKLAADAVRAACAPLIVTAQPAGRSVTGTHLDVHLVSDLRVPLTDLTVEMGWRGEEPSHRWQGDVPADSCIRVGTVTLDDRAAVAVELAVRDASGGLMTANTYQIHRNV